MTAHANVSCPEEVTTNMTYEKYHWRDGVYFRRSQVDEGTVEIEIPDFDDPKKVNTLFIPPSEWASIVAAVCCEGGNAERYREALALHMRPVE